MPSHKLKSPSNKILYRLVLGTAYFTIKKDISAECQQHNIEHYSFKCKTYELQKKPLMEYVTQNKINV